MRPKTPRLAPSNPADYSDEQAQLAGGRGNPRGELNIVRLLVQHPALYRHYFQFAMHLIAASSLAPREREIIILHTCALCGDKYDMAQHRVIAQRAGLSTADIEAAIHDGACLSDFECTLLKAAEELVREQCIADATYAALAERYTPRQLLDFVFTVGNYTLMAMTTRTFDVQKEADVEGGWKPG